MGDPFGARSRAILPEVQAGTGALQMGPSVTQEDCQVSDQDFFFDEDEAPTKDTSEETSKPVKSSGASRPAATGAAAPAAQSVSMAVAGLIGVIALLAGIIIGIILPVGGGSSIPAPGPGATVPSTPAPQLSPDQLDSDLPPGHPPIGDGQAPGAPGGDAGAPSEETTPN